MMDPHQRRFFRLARGRSRGLTIVELLLVVAVLGTVTAMAVPTFYRSILTSAAKRAVIDIQTLQLEIDLFERMNERLPITLDELGTRRPFRDHWGRRYQYLPNTAPNWEADRRTDQSLQPVNADYDLFSSGPDRNWSQSLASAVSYDDTVRAGDGRYIGVASEY